MPAGAVGTGPEGAAGAGVGKTSRSASMPRIEPMITPANTSAAVNALTSTARTISQNFTLTCTSPGVKTMSFNYSLALKNAADTDPDLTNNSGQASFQIDCVVPIVINVRPHGFPNSINLNTDASLAALTTTAGEYGLPLAFDASTVQIETVRWGLRSNLFNVAVATVSVPTKGLSLPLVSAGGSGLVITCAALGVLYSVARHRHRPDEQDTKAPQTAPPVPRQRVVTAKVWDRFTAPT